MSSTRTLLCEAYTDNPVIQTLAQEMAASRTRQPERYVDCAVRIMASLTALIKKAEHEQRQPLFRRSGVKNAYGPKRKHPWMTRAMLDTWKAIEDALLVDVVMTYKPPRDGKAGKTTMYKPSPIMIEIASQISSSEIIPHPTRRHVELDKKQIKPEMIASSNRLVSDEEILEQHFALLLQHPVTEDRYVVPATDLFYVRKYLTKEESNVALGGRIYAPIQQLPKVRRQALRIGGQKVISLDYRGLHPTMLRLQYLGKQPEGMLGDAAKDILGLGDPYTLEGWKREDVKAFVNRMLNCSSLQKSISTIRRARRIDGKIDFNWNNKEGLSIFENKAAIQHFIDAYAEAHPDIAWALHGNVGVTLQREDSQMMLSIMDILTTHAIPCLPIHDEIIVPEEHEHITAYTMKRVSEQQLGAAIPTVASSSPKAPMSSNNK